MAEIDYSQVTGLVHSTESFGSVDGPGIRFIVFMQGCKMRCQYCHNPDTWAMESNKAVERTVEDVLDEALRFRHFWGEHGGITVSGGEAMLQIDFVTALFTEAKKLGGTQTVLDDLNLYIRENEFLTLLGPSGCGKTTTLRILGGFETPDCGQVIFDGEDITNLPPNKRQLNTVFQKYALFTHMTIAENIAFGLKIKKKSKQYIYDKIKYALKLVNLDGYENRMPDSLSGGQQQRIAIARAIVNEPKVLLLDEPLGALDLKLRQDMQYELIRLKNELGITFIYVTHDQEEALTMSDTIVVMNQGYIQQIGTPERIYNEPENAFRCCPV